jgi:hypothetical protein
MLTPQINSKFVTKILTNQNGESFRVVFLVGYVGGKMHAQVVSSELIVAVGTSASTASADATATEIFQLPEPRRAAVAEFFYTPSHSPIASPLATFDFFMSQPTRAPSGK